MTRVIPENRSMSGFFTGIRKQWKMSVQVNMPTVMTYYSTEYTHIVVTASNVLASQLESDQCENFEPNTLSVSLFNLNHDDTLSSP